MDLLNYKRHFLLLAGVASASSVTSGWTRALGPIGSGAVYGALHAAALVLTLRSAPALWLRGVFVLVAALQSAVAVSLALAVGRVSSVLLGSEHPALLLAVCAGIGALGYAMFIRAAFQITLSPAAVSSIALGCVASDLVVLSARLYLHGGVVWFAIVWWFALSLGLWCQEARCRVRQS